MKYNALRDSIFSADKLEKLGSVELKYMLAQQEKQDELALNRKRLITYSIVALIILVVVILLFYSSRLSINPKFLSVAIFITLLLFFEFVLVIIDPLVSRYTLGSPILTIVANFVVALLFIPVNRWLEAWLERTVVHSKTKAKG